MESTLTHSDAAEYPSVVADWKDWRYLWKTSRKYSQRARSSRVRKGNKLSYWRALGVHQAPESGSARPQKEPFLVVNSLPRYLHTQAWTGKTHHFPFDSY